MLPSYASHLHPKPREWTDFIRLISRSRKLICTRTDEFGLIIARVRAILNETGQTPYEDRVLVRKNYCMTYWQLKDIYVVNLRVMSINSLY